jgi:hypothetical protein
MRLTRQNWSIGYTCRPKQKTGAVKPTRLTSQLLSADVKLGRQNNRIDNRSPCVPPLMVSPKSRIHQKRGGDLLPVWFFEGANGFIYVDRHAARNYFF